MKLSTPDLKSLRHMACEAAKAAGDLINAYATRPVEVKLKADTEHLASQVVTEVDRKSEALILDVLKPSQKRYDLALLTEEREDDRQRLVKDYFWCIDPLDGTLAFTESQPGYAVSIALVSRAGSPVLGVIYDPRQCELYSAIKGRGAKKNEETWQFDARHSDCLTLPCDRSFVDREDFETRTIEIQKKAEAIGFKSIEFLKHGGAVMNAISVIDQAPAIYFKAPKANKGGGSIWDFSATTCLFSELGAHVSDYRNAPLSLNPPGSTFMNHCGVIFASSAELAQIAR